MRLAVNWSPAAEKLVLEGKIDVDLWKCSDWPELVGPALKTRPAYVHFPIHTSADFNVDWAKVRGWMDITGTKNVNMHLVATRKDFPDIPFDSRDPAHRERVITMMVDCIERAGKEMGIERIVCENLPSARADDEEHPWPIFAAIDPLTVREAILRSGARLLLDLDHARNAADLLGMDAKEYVEILPVDRIGELHMSGVQQQGDRLEDHMGLSAECWTYVDWAIGEMHAGRWATPDICAFEYGGIGPVFRDRCNPAVLEAQVPRLLAGVRSLNK